MEDKDYHAWGFRLAMSLIVTVLTIGGLYLNRKHHADDQDTQHQTQQSAPAAAPAQPQQSSDDSLKGFKIN